MMYQSALIIKSALSVYITSTLTQSKSIKVMQYIAISYNNS